LYGIEHKKENNLDAKGNNDVHPLENNTGSNCKKMNQILSSSIIKIHHAKKKTKILINKTKN